MQPDIEHARFLARILNRTTFTSLARGDDPRNIFKHYLNVLESHPPETPSKLYAYVYNLISKNYRNEYIYKSAIADRIVFGRHSPSTSALSIELPVGRSIVDAAVFNGTSTAYEIKTEFDSPRRLISQTPDYTKAFDKIYIVTHPQHAKRYAEKAEPHIGVLSLTTKGSLSEVKPATSNINNIDQQIIFRMLRRDEFLPALERLIERKIELPNGIIRTHCEKIFLKLSKESAHNIYINAMRKRTTSPEIVNFMRSLPNHLRVLGYSSSLSRPQRAKLLSALETKLN
ncbi:MULTISPECIES: sce7726 family protein [Gammaproteobacteria]|uniref:sce7726 family protein n=1 Tax=Gammaproteobacteria TaxID=1236 RepID=UPI001912F5BE|nr:MULTISPECIES: sce7726 family protein [Gammaproteobacteria]MBK5300095.1 sce7726 family protein [Bacillus sp. TH86]MBK5319864.1 sce7726 family protein [Bacillus sp. TH59]MBK5334814.1 sce7726 family protein [Bacillus sp. TH57]MBK5308903.1 sce7726 family protein [Pseudomonas sp. TH71]MBK5314363.1 sce7726 family protein [Erwinia sp. TH79]